MPETRNSLPEGVFALTAEELAPLEAEHAIVREHLVALGESFTEARWPDGRPTFAIVRAPLERCQLIPGSCLWSRQVEWQIHATIALPLRERAAVLELVNRHNATRLDTVLFVLGRGLACRTTFRPRVVGHVKSGLGMVHEDLVAAVAALSPE